MYPKEVVEFAKDAVNALKKENQLFNELNSLCIGIDLLEEKFLKLGLSNFINGREMEIKKEEFLALIEEALFETNLATLVDKKLIDSIENEKGEIVYFGTKKLISLLKKC